MDLYELVVAPFAEFDFMRYALASIFCLALSAAPVGVFLVMRRMSLVGDALSHAVLPGAAIGYMFAGWSFRRGSILRSVTISRTRTWRLPSMTCTRAPW